MLMRFHSELLSSARCVIVSVTRRRQTFLLRAMRIGEVDWGDVCGPPMEAFGVPGGFARVPGGVPAACPAVCPKWSAQVCPAVCPAGL